MLLDYQTLVDKLVRDDAGQIATEDRDQAIALAVERYSQDRPRQKVEDLTAPGGHTLALPAAWESDFSVLTSLEYPVGNVPPTTYEVGAWGMYNAPVGLQIMVRDAFPEGATVRASYTIKHALDATNDTIPVHNREAVACWAAAILCDELASLYSGDTDSTIQADAVDHKSKASEFARRARDLRKRYLDELGIEPKRSAAAGVVVNLDLADSRGNDRLLHPRRYR